MSWFLRALDRAEQEHAQRELARENRSDPIELRPDDAISSLGQETSSAADKAVAEPPFEPLPVDALAKEKVPRAEPKSAQEPRHESRMELDHHLVSLLNPTSFEAEQYRTLRYIVEQVRKENGLQVLAVTSPTVGDGKTTTAINLAGALAQSPDVRVLLVDADLRLPSVAAQLGMDDSGHRPGLVDAIRKSALSLKDVEWTLPIFKLSVLPPGRQLANPYEVLKSPRLGQLLEEARQRFHYIIVDTPPVVPVPDCRVISRCVDGFLMVVAAHKTPRKLLEEALNVVDPAKVVGLVFNEDNQPLLGYYGYHYAPGQSHNGNGTPWWLRLVKRLEDVSGINLIRQPRE